MAEGEGFESNLYNMKMLITETEYNKTKSRTLIPLECEYCRTIFYLTKHDIQSAILRCGDNGAKYCSQICNGITSRVAKQVVTCEQCNKEFEKLHKEFKESKHHFCSRSCAATYHNTHKTQGTRRSNLEQYLEKQIEANYPELDCLYNDKTIIGSEIDFYFPTLKLAFELNGIFHYEPIYGNDKLEQIQNNDEQKAIRCNSLGIELCIIDSSTQKHFTQKSGEKYWNIVKELLQRIYKRHVSYL